MKTYAGLQSSGPVIFHRGLYTNFASKTITSGLYMNMISRRSATYKSYSIVNFSAKHCFITSEAFWQHCNVFRFVIGVDLNSLDRFIKTFNHEIKVCFEKPRWLFLAYHKAPPVSWQRLCYSRALYTSLIFCNIVL